MLNACRYDSFSPRSCSRDPIGYWDSDNPYGYVKDNPANHEDPKGTQIESQTETTGACDIHLYRYPQRTGRGGLIYVGDHIGAMIDWKPYLSNSVVGDAQDYIDGTKENDVEETGRRPQNRPQRPSRSFWNVPQQNCDCFNSSVASWRQVPDDQRVREETNRNSNWIMKCLLKRCGMNVEWNSSSPIGWNGNTGKCLEWNIREGATLRCLWTRVCTKYQECPDGFDSSIIAPTQVQR